MINASKQQKQEIADAQSEDLTLHPDVKPEDVALDLSATARTAAGRLYWEGDKLVYLGMAGIDFTTAFELISPEEKSALKANTLNYANSKKISITTLLSTLYSIRAALVRFPSKKFDLRWASAAIENSTFRGSKFQIRQFLEFTQKRYPSLVSNEALNLIAQAEGRGLTSRNVLSDNPEKSWLTSNEYDAVLNSVWDFFDTTACTQTTLIRLLSLQYARRPIQLRNLKFGDLKSGTNKQLKNLAENEIHFPAAKEKDTETDFRDGKIEIHPISDHLWKLLKIQKKQIIQAFEDTLDVKLGATEVELLPIFTQKSRIKMAASWLTQKLGLDPVKNIHHELFHVLSSRMSSTIGFVYNLGINRVSEATGKRIPGPVTPVSERTHQPIVVNANRLRHTRARQLARQGVPKPILSYWLGHNDDKAIDSYFNDPAEEARTLDEKMSKGLTPLSMAFQGRIITSDADATHANDPSKRLEFASDGALHYVAHCGKSSFCATTSIPLACYRCNKFEPLVDAPHEEVLEALIYRQSQEQELIKIGGMRKLLIPIDLSADIHAVERCIELCKLKREQIEEQASKEKKEEGDQ